MREHFSRFSEVIGVASPKDGFSAVLSLILTLYVVGECRVKSW